VASFFFFFFLLFFFFLFFFFFFSTSSMKKLFLSRSAPPSHANVSADHLTLAFRPDAQTIAKFAPLLGSTGPRLRATGVADNGRAQAVVIEETEVTSSGVFSLLPTTTGAKATAPHITVSVAAGVENREAGMLARKVVDKGLVSTSSASSSSAAPACASEEAISVSSWQGDPTFLSGTLGLMMESGRVVLAEEAWAEVAREEEEEEEEEEERGDDESGEDVAAFLSTPPLQMTMMTSSPSSKTSSSTTAALSVGRLLEAWRLGEKGGVQAAVAATAADADAAAASAAASAAAAGARLSFPSPRKKKSAAMPKLALPSRGLEELTRARELARMSREGQSRAERWLELWASGRNAPAALPAETTCCSSPSPSRSRSSFSPKRSPSPLTGLADSASETANGEHKQEQKQRSPPPRLPSLSALAAVDMFEVSSPGSAPPEAACPLAVADVLSRGRAASRARAEARETSDRERATSERHRAARDVFDRAAAVAAALGDEQASAELAARAWEHRALALEARARANESAFAGVNGGHVNRFRLDLHGMHVPEALSVLRRHCATLAGLAHPSGVLLQVVTGWGRNSSSGVPRVRPAVLEWLASNSRHHREDVNNAGMVYILLGGDAKGEWGE